MQSLNQSERQPLRRPANIMKKIHFAGTPPLCLMFHGSIKLRNFSSQRKQQKYNQPHKGSQNQDQHQYQHKHQHQRLDLGLIKIVTLRYPLKDFCRQSEPCSTN